MKKLLSVLMILALTLAFGGSAAMAQEELKDFSVILDWYPNALHAFLYRAQEKGYFAEEGLNVTLTAPAGFSDGLTFPVAGRAQVGLYYMSDIVNAYANEGMPVRVIGALTQNTLNVLASLTESGIEDPSMLAGKTIGYTGGSGLEAKIRTLTESVGLHEGDYQLIDIGFDIVTALTTRNVDVAGGGMINHEVVQMEKSGFPITYWNWQDFGVPQEYNTVFVTSDAQYSADPELFAAFLRACKKGYDDVEADPEAALQLIMSQSDMENYPLDPDVERESFRVLGPIMQTEVTPFLSMDKQVWADLIAWMQQTGQIAEAFDPAEMATDALYGNW